MDGGRICLFLDRNLLFSCAAAAKEGSSEEGKEENDGKGGGREGREMLNFI
jgi:hypothetical protein